MNKEDHCSDCNLEMRREENLFGNWFGECCNCDSRPGDDDDLMNIFNMAEVWFSDGKNEEYLFGDSEEE